MRATYDQPSPTEAARTRGNGRVVQLPGVTCILHPIGRADLIVLSRVLLRLLRPHRRYSHGTPSSVNFRIQPGTGIANFFGRYATVS